MPKWWEFFYIAPLIVVSILHGKVKQRPNAIEEDMPRSYLVMLGLGRNAAKIRAHVRAMFKKTTPDNGMAEDGWTVLR
jgi:hypothetical protein